MMEPIIETVTVPLDPDLIDALKRLQDRMDALDPLTEEARAKVEAAEWRLLFGDTEEVD